MLLEVIVDEATLLVLGAGAFVIVGAEVAALEASSSAPRRQVRHRRLRHGVRGQLWISQESLCGCCFFCSRRTFDNQRFVGVCLRAPPVTRPPPDVRHHHFVRFNNGDISTVSPRHLYSVSNLNTPTRQKCQK